MRNIQLVLLCITMAMFAVSCSGKKSFAFDDVVYVEQFPVECELGIPDVLEINAIGVQGIKVFDDYVLLSCHDSCGCLSAFGKDGGKISSSFLNIGRGPGEMLFRPFTSWFDFVHSPDGHLVAGIFDFKGNYVEYDVTESLASGMTSWRVIADSLSLASGARYFRIDDENLLCRRLNMDNNGYERFVVNASDAHLCNAAMARLNSITSTESNLLSTFFLIDQKRHMVAELGSRLNVINLYSLDSDFKSTVSLGKSLENILEIEQKPEEEMSRIYNDANAYDDFFAGLYLRATFSELDEGRFSAPELHLFSWDGRPLARISLPVRTLYFDIDVNKKELYVVEYETEKILRYDISEVLDSKVFVHEK